MNGAKRTEGRVVRTGRPALVLCAVVGIAAPVVVAAACSSGGDAQVSLEAGASRCPGTPSGDAAAFAWTPPTDAGSGPCDVAALDRFATALRQEGATWSEIEAAVRAAEDASASSAACAACIFTDTAEAAWGPVVRVDGDAGAAFVNYGACYARAPGGSDACGRAVHVQTRCLEEVCNLEVCRPEGLRLCAQQALQETTTGCGRFDVATACDQGIAQLGVACRNPLDVVTRLCARPATADAGADAGAP